MGSGRSKIGEHENQEQEEYMKDEDEEEQEEEGAQRGFFLISAVTKKIESNKL